MSNNYEIEVLGGLEEFAEQELTYNFGDSMKVIGRPTKGRIAIEYIGDMRLLNGLKSVTAVHLLEKFDIPRPKALLGNQNVNRVLESIDFVLKRNRDKEFKTLRVSGAGANSSVFTRLKQEISSHTKLEIVEEPANLHITVRRAQNSSSSWQVLVRTSSMPLSSREWRVCSFPGALNASIAHVMATMASPTDGERYLNLCCGSGTLMIERLDIKPAKSVVGIDNHERVLKCAETNLKASEHHKEVKLIRGDVGDVPMPDASIDTIVADLPYGMLTGERSNIDRTYNQAVSEATRVAAPNASLLMITTRKKLFEAVLDDFGPYWDRIRTIPVSVPYRKGYIQPAIYWLQRKA